MRVLKQFSGGSASPEIDTGYHCIAFDGVAVHVLSEMDCTDITKESH